MSLFTKTRRNFRSGYEKIDDVETRSHSRSPDPGTSSKNDGYQHYRAAFFGLSALYLLTIVFAITLWQFGGITPGNRAASPEKIVEMPHDQKVMFQKSDQFEAPRKEEAEDDPWGLLQPAGRGFIEVPLDVTRSDGSKSVDKQYYCISMFHQLHCLASLKAAFESSSNDKHEFIHLDHCFDYLRQAVMCAGDMTLEPAYKYMLKNEEVKAVNGWNVVHQCRNYDRIKEYAEEHRYANSSGIL